MVLRDANVLRGYGRHRFNGPCRTAISPYDLQEDTVPRPTIRIEPINQINKLDLDNLSERLKIFRT